MLLCDNAVKEIFTWNCLLELFLVDLLLTAKRKGEYLCHISFFLKMHYFAFSEVKQKEH